MRHLGRSLAVVAIGAVSVLATGLPASAAEGCDREDASYGAGGVCVVNVQADPICPDGALLLSYAVTSEGTEATTVDLRWLNPGGTDVVLAGQPFAGTIAWPASIPQRTTDVQFVVGTEAVVNVDPTAALAACVSGEVVAVNSVQPAATTGVLALTGSEVLPFAAAGAGLLLAGTALVLARSARLRRAAQD